MPDQLTPKQEAFALRYFELGNAAEAYRQSHDVEPDNMAGWVYTEARRLVRDPRIALRLKELRQRAEDVSMYSKTMALREYEKARKNAAKAGQHSAAVSAINGKVKLFGLDAPTKVEHTGNPDKPVVIEGIGFDVIDKLPTETVRQIRAAGLEAAEEESAQPPDA